MLGGQVVRSREGNISNWGGRAAGWRLSQMAVPRCGTCWWRRKRDGPNLELNWRPTSSRSSKRSPTWFRSTAASMISYRSRTSQMKTAMMFVFEEILEELIGDCVVVGPDTVDNSNCSNWKTWWKNSFSEWSLLPSMWRVLRMGFPRSFLPRSMFRGS